MRKRLSKRRIIARNRLGKPVRFCDVERLGIYDRLFGGRICHLTLTIRR